MSPIARTVAGIHRARQATSSSVRVGRGGLLVAWVAVVLVSSGGCGKDRLDVSPVRGKVVYNGQSVPNAIVIFFPIEPVNEKAKKMRPFAYANMDGQFEIKTYIDGDGAAPGKYRVSIIAPASTGAPKSGKDRPADEPIAAAGPVVRVPPAIIKKYANVDTSGIEVDVQEGENNLEPFELKM